jgi:hypothetical protein
MFMSAILRSVAATTHTESGMKNVMKIFDTLCFRVRSP